MFAKHGLRNLVEKINLDNFLTQANETQEDKESLTIAARLRLSFEELGPTFVKFGQLLASRPDLIPQEYVDEMTLLHDQAQPLEFKVIKDVLSEEFGPQWMDLFSSIEEQPLGSASIAQVHRATLKDQSRVVIKVQRPFIVEKINDDLNVLYFIAELLEKYVPEVRPFNPVGMIDEYFKTLELETNFVVEANNMRRFRENFKDESHVVIPYVDMNLVTERVLIMQELEGKPLSQVRSLEQLGLSSEEIIKAGLKSYLKMVFVDGFFHGDLHPGNFFILKENKIGLIDFGVVGRLNSKTQTAIVNMLIALSKEDYLRLAYEYVDIAPFSEDVNVDLFAKDLQSVIAPYYGLSLKQSQVGKVLMSSASTAAHHGLMIPTELMLFFKSIIAIDGLGQRISKDFDFLGYTLSQIGEIAQNYFQPVKFASEASLLLRESRTFLNTLPRQLNLILRKINSPNYHTRLKIDGLDELKTTIAHSFNLLFLGIIIAALIISSSVIWSSSLNQPQVHMTAGFPTLSLIGYLSAGLLAIVSFINYIRSQ